MRLKIYLLVLLGLVGLSFSYAATINGTATHLAGTDIKLSTYTDYFTYTEKVLASALISNEGSFTLTIENESTLPVILSMGSIKAILYIEKGKTYDIALPEADTLSITRMNQELWIVPEIINSDKAELNMLIRRFNDEYDGFVSDHLEDFIRKTAKTKVDTFVVKMRKSFASVQNSFFKHYAEYNYAVLLASSFHSRTKIAEEFIYGKPVLYDNDAYMNFFNQFFAQQIKNLPPRLYDEIVVALKEKMSRTEMMNILANDELLKDERVREFVLIQTLFENFNNPDYSTKSVLTVLSEIEEVSPYKEHKAIAGILVDKLSGTSIGSYAPDFELIDPKGNKVKLSSFRGKYVYLDFWATWCAPCVKEMKLVPALHEKYGKHVEFVSVSIDKKQKAYERFLKKNKYEWTFLYAGDDQALMDLFNVKSIPQFYLIDPYGKIVQSPAFRPSSMENTFKDVTRKMKGR